MWGPLRRVLAQRCLHSWSGGAKATPAWSQEGDWQCGRWVTCPEFLLLPFPAVPVSSPVHGDTARSASRTR